MNGLSLCAGIGGLDLACKAVWPDYKTVCYVEIEPFCQDVLIRRSEDGWLDRAPIWPDLRAFDGRPWRGLVDCVVSGFPCQPFSVAGLRRGAADERNLWPEVRRVVAECGASALFLENVLGALPYFFHVVLPELQDLGYAVETRLVTAAEVGAPHRRGRIFALAVAETPIRGTIVASENSGGRPSKTGGPGRPMDNPTSPRCVGRFGQASQATRNDAWRRESGGRRVPVGHPVGEGLAGRQGSIGDRTDELPAWPPSPGELDRWRDIVARWPDVAPALAHAGGRKQRRSNPSGRKKKKGEAIKQLHNEGEVESPFRRVVDGVPSRVDRLRALGNAVVPAQAERALRLMLTSAEEAMELAKHERRGVGGGVLDPKP